MQEYSDESVYFEALDKVLESWMNLVEHVGDLPTNTLLSPAVDIFNAFVHCHLAQPDGNRSIVNISAVLSVCYRYHVHYAYHQSFFLNL